MRRTIVLSLALSFAAAASPAGAMVGAPFPVAHQATPTITKVEYYCSPGFAPSYGRCIATESSDEVELYLNDPGGYDEAPAPVRRVVRHRHRHHGLAERY